MLIQFQIQIFLSSLCHFVFKLPYSALLCLFIVFFPLITASLILLTGRFLGRHGASRLAITGLGTVCIASWTLFLSPQQFYYWPGYVWFKTATGLVTTDLLFDNLTTTMLVVVTTISFIVHWYSYDYMYTDPHLPRFMAYLSFFTFFMLLLVTAADFAVLFIGWEGVGLLSYLLINFWYTRIQANKSALKAIFINKIGDIAILAGIALLYYITGSTNLLTIQSVASYVVTDPVFTVYYSTGLVCLIIGAVGKSAQLFLHVWLPDAMEGPTPVSALLHAATMVTAGVFLVLRNATLFELDPWSLFVIACLGSLTTFFAATTGTAQFDLKRIIAFSTCSQLGYMFTACGVSAYSTSLFHLFNHAFFKALLFLAAGSIIHALQNEQDIRRMGGLAVTLPLTCTFFIIGSASLMGVPYFSGYYSKDLVLEIASHTLLVTTPFAYLLATASAVLTAYYSMRLLFFVFYNPGRTVGGSVHEPNWYVQGPLYFLGLLSIFSGYLFFDWFCALGNFFGTPFLPIHSTVFTVYSDLLPEYGPVLYDFLPLGGVLLGQWTAGYVFTESRHLCLADIGKNEEVERLYYLTNKWCFDSLYNTIFYRTGISLLKHFYFFLDKGLIEHFGPKGVTTLLSLLAKSVSHQQSGSLSAYIQQLVVLLFAGLIIWFPLLSNL